MSYSTDGIIPIEQIETILKRHCISNTLKRYDIPYRSYKSKKDNQQHMLYEHVFFIKKCEDKQYTYFNKAIILNNKSVNKA